LFIYNEYSNRQDAYTSRHYCTSNILCRMFWRGWSDLQSIDYTVRVWRKSDEMDLHSICLIVSMILSVKHFLSNSWNNDRLLRHLYWWFGRCHMFFFLSIIIWFWFEYLWCPFVGWFISEHLLKKASWWWQMMLIDAKLKYKSIYTRAPQIIHKN